MTPKIRVQQHPNRIAATGLLASRRIIQVYSRPISKWLGKKFKEYAWYIPGIFRTYTSNEVEYVRYILCQVYTRHIPDIWNELTYSRYISEYSRYIELVVICMEYYRNIQLLQIPDDWHLQQSGSHPAVTGSARAVSYVISALNVRVCEIQVVSARLPLHGASDCYWCASRRGSSVSALKRSYDCPPFGTINLHARARANVRARDIKGELTPLQGM